MHFMTHVYEITYRLISEHTIMPWKEKEETISKIASVDFETRSPLYKEKK